MGYFGKLEEKQLAQKLRGEGLSYGEILKKVKVSKGTLSRWCKDIILTDSQKKRLLESKSLGQRKGSLVAAENKRRLRISKIENIFGLAKKDLGELSKRDRFIAGIALYAGEGAKTDGNGGFANTNPTLIKFMMKWFIEFCRVPIDKIRGSLWLHEGLSEVKAKKYWSELTGIPINQFYKTYFAINKIDSKKIRKNIHEYGVFAIRFNDRERHRQIMGWISALVGDKIPPVRKQRNGPL